MAAASMNVAIGSLQDPFERPGLAHFLEHMLFMGSKKYPDEKEYSEYISQHAGEDNAWTSEIDTNYFFEIDPKYFENGLDRFAQFFISPLFDKDCLSREMKAVNSEHESSINSDNERL